MKIAKFSFIHIALLLVIPAVSLFGQIPDEIAEFTYGGKLFEDGLFDLALIQYQRFADRFPGSAKMPEALFRIGECYLETGQYADARNEYYQLLIRFEESPLAARAQMRIAESYEKAGDIRKAAEACYRVFAYYPESDSAHQCLYRSAVLYAEIGMLAKSEAYIRSLLNAAAGEGLQSSATFLLLDIYFTQGKFQECESLASSLIASPLREGDGVKAAFVLGRVYEQRADWEAARALYERMLQGEGGGSRDAARLTLRLARVLVLLNMTEEAAALCSAAGANAPEGSLRAEALQLLGDIYYENGQYTEAADAYRRAGLETDARSITNEAAWNYFRTLIALQQPRRAAAGLDSLLSDSLFPQQLLPRMLLTAASAWRAAGDYSRTVACLDRYADTFTADPLLPRVLLSKASAIIASGDLTDEAASSLQRVISEYRGSGEALEARFRYGELLAETGREREAMHLFSGLRDTVPWTIWGKRASDLLEDISYTTVEGLRRSLLRLTDLVRQYAASSADHDMLHDIGVLCFDSMGRYRDAIGYHRAYLALADSGSRAEISLYQIAESYRRLARRTGDPELADSAAIAFQELGERYPDGPYAATAGLAGLQLRGQDDIDGYLDLYTRFENTPAAPGIIFNLGRAFEKADSLPRARELYAVVHGRYSDTPDAEAALFRDARLCFSAGLIPTGDSLSTVLRMRYPRSAFLPELFLERAEAVRESAPETAIALLKELLNTYPHSESASKAVRLLAPLLLQTERFEEAAAFCRASLRRDSLETVAAETGLVPGTPSMRRELLSCLGAACKELGDYAGAADAYLRLLRNGPEIRIRVNAYLRLAEIERLAGREEVALRYLALVPNEAVTDSVAEERGTIHLRIGRYPEAAHDFALAEELAANDSLKAVYTARYISVLYRQHQFSTADARLASFVKTYRQLPDFLLLNAEISMEKAKVYAEDKQFDKSVEILREMLKRDIGEAEPEARLELGKNYLKMNQIEEALPLLTAMPSTYPGHPVLAEVYLNLGDHYHNSKQYANATFAYRKATEIATDPDISRIAYNRLMNSQAGQALYDGAMATAREYIARFPNAPDVLNYREKIGDFYTELHDYRRAIEIYRDLKPYADPQMETSLQYKLGQCYDAMGLFQEAVFEYLKVAYLSKPTNTLPWKATALYNAGQAYQKLDEPEKARRMYEMIIEREGPGSHFGKFALERIEEIARQSSDRSKNP
ncbi:tetratricopeptide repeat protein [bacterium]|nr:tetratricopeptide repeat protein [bacterium]